MKEATSAEFAVAVSQLCHMEASLAEAVWLEAFPRLWATLESGQRAALAHELLPFVTSGAHILQKDCHPSALNTFVEALSRCDPPVHMPAPLMKYVGKSHNLWHRMVIDLERQVFQQQQREHDAHGRGRSVRHHDTPAPSVADCYEFEPEGADGRGNAADELADALAELYWLLREEDMWAGLWQRHARYRETNVAIAYEQQGFFEQAQLAYEQAMARHKQEAIAGSPDMPHHREAQLWTEHWTRYVSSSNRTYIQSKFNMRYLMIT